jgi:hypothetical protein
MHIICILCTYSSYNTQKNYIYHDAANNLSYFFINVHYSYTTIQQNSSHETYKEIMPHIN